MDFQHPETLLSGLPIQQKNKYRAQKVYLKLTLEEFQIV